MRTLVSFLFRSYSINNCGLSLRKMLRRDLFIFFMTIAIVQVIADVSETFNNEP